MDCNTTNLTSGSTGTSVEELQKTLKNKGYYTGKIDGNFGEYTKKAVIHYQGDKKLVTDGKVGPITCKSLGMNTGTGCTSTNLKQGCKGPNVLDWQTWLKKNGFYFGALDSSFGPYMKQAVERFQGQMGTSADGVIGPKTIAARAKYDQNAKTVSTTKSAFHKSVEAALGGPYEDFTGYYILLNKKKWKGYKDDEFNLAQEIARDAQDLPLNCSDGSQEAKAVADDLGGYDFRYAHIYCKKSGGHIYLEGKGRELGSKYKDIDTAARRQSGYALGKRWCNDVKPSSYNDSWLVSDDGLT